MEPITMAMLLGSSALSAAGELYKGFAASRAGRLKAQIADANSRTLKTQGEIEHDNADLSLQRGAFEATKFLRVGERTANSQGAYFSANAVDPLYGSPLMLAGATVAQASVDAALARARGAGEAAGHEARSAQAYGAAASQSGQALGFAEQGEAALIAGIFGAGAQLLGGGAKAWANLSTNAPTPNSGGGFTVGAPLDLSPPQQMGNAWDIH